ncbi:MAG TPA: hypothetical protein VF476_11710 [Chitinophagaceae bacterium]
MIQLTDWSIDPIEKYLVIGYDKEGEEMVAILHGAKLTDALVECRVFETYDKKGAFTHTVESSGQNLTGLTQGYTVTTPIEEVLERFNHYVDNNQINDILNWQLKSKTK